MERIEITDILSYRFVSDVQAAPAGERAVFTVRSCDEKNNSYLSDLYLWEEGTVRRLTTDGKSHSAVWENESTILFPAMRLEADRERAKNGEVFSVWYRLNIHGGEAEKAFEIPAACSRLYALGKDQWYFAAQIDRKHPDEYKMTEEARKALAAERKEGEDYHVLTDADYRLNGQGYMEGTATALFTFNSASGQVQRITSADENVSFLTACGSEILYGASRCLKTTNLYTQVYVCDPADGSVRTVYGGNDYGISDGFYVDGRILLLASDYRKAGLNQNNGIYTPVDGKLELVCDPDLSFDSSVGSDCRLGGGAYARVRNNTLYFTCTVEGRCELRRLTGDGRVVTVNNAEGSLDSFDITSSGTILGTGLYGSTLTELYRIGSGKKLTKLTGFNDACLLDKYVAVPNKLSLRSCGRRIDGWVLLPKDYDPSRRYPAVLDIHGGPKTVYGEVLYHEMQVWASRGYFVFFCNPIGSDGRGNAFMDIRGKYGTVDYRNIMDFTDAVLAQYPQIDPARVAVTGGSYGGFMTNWILGHTDRFACAASQRSISNWFSFYGASDIGIYFNNDQNAANIFDGQKEIWNHSPLKYAANFTTPTLFIHSEDDYRCPIDQGLQMYAVLLEKGIDTRFVWFKGENHDLSRTGKPRHRIKRLNEITAWIEKYTR